MDINGILPESTSLPNRIGKCDVQLIERLPNDERKVTPCGGDLWQHSDGSPVVYQWHWVNGVAKRQTRCPECFIRLGKIADEYAGFFVYEDHKASAETRTRIRGEISDKCHTAGFTLSDVDIICHEEHGGVRAKVRDAWEAKNVT